MKPRVYFSRDYSHRDKQEHTGILRSYEKNCRNETSTNNAVGQTRYDAFLGKLTHLTKEWKKCSHTWENNDTAAYIYSKGCNIFMQGVEG